jgi:hypothetical protein
MKITVAEFDASQACQSAKNNFRERFPEGFEVTDANAIAQSHLVSYGSWAGYLWGNQARNEFYASEEKAREAYDNVSGGCHTPAKEQALRAYRDAVAIAFVALAQKYHQTA